MRKRFPPFGMKSTISNIIKSSLVSTIGYFASTTFKMATNLNNNNQNNKYQQ